MAGAVIRANRAEVNDRFPMLGFTVRTGSRPYFEVAVTTDPALLAPDRRGDRAPNSFWSSRGLGPLPAERGEAICIVPDDVLRRFAGAGRLYYAVATFSDRTRGNPDVTRTPPELAPFVLLSPGYTGRRLRQLVGGRGESARWNGTGTRYAQNDKSSLEWAGDSGQPGVEPAATPAPDAPESGAVSAGLAYDDGFGERLWQETRQAGVSDFDLGWPEVPMVAEDLTIPGWLASAAMVIGWRDGRPAKPQELLALLSGLIAGSVDGLSTENLATIARALKLEPESPATHTVASFRQLLTTRGPLCVGVAVVPPRFVVVTGLHGDGTPTGTFVRISDPSGHPLGAQLPTVGGIGASYVLTFQQFLDSFAMIAPGAGLQAIHVTEADMQGRAPVVTSQAYAMGAPRGRLAARPASVARAYAVPAVVPIASAIIGATMTRIMNNEGDVSWELDQLKGLKHPADDSARSGSANFKTVVTPVKDWPVVESGLSDQIYADFEIEWQGNGHSVGNVAIKNTHTNDAVGWGLTVKATINDDSTIYEGDQAAIRVSFNYRFDRSLGPDAIAIRDFTLYADGTIHENSRWTQKPDGWTSTEQGVSRAQGGEGGGIISEIVSPIVETTLKMLVDSAGSDLSYEVPYKLDGMKHVGNNAANKGAGPVRTIDFDHKLPWRENGFSDEISLTFNFSFQYDGRSLGNVVVRRSGANDAVGWSLKVKGELVNDDGEYTDGKGGPTFAAIRLPFQCTYDGGIGPLDIVTKVALSDIMLYGNGTYSWKEKWTQD